MVINTLLKKYFLKPLYYIFIFLVIFTFYELTNINFKYVNKDLITIDINNIRNPQIKKIVRYLDNNFAFYYFKFSEKKQKEFFNNNFNEYEILQNEEIIPGGKKNLTPTNNKNFNNNDNWLRSHGNHSSNKFSNLKQINIKNIENLKLAWEFGFEKNGVIPGNPVFYDGRIFLSSTDKSLIALNIETGKKLWEFKTEGKAAPRGLMISQEKEPKIYFCDQFNLISLIPETGMPNLNFGKKVC